jgi:transcriptional regulator with GAF, ATPase, and Fis domain
MSMKPASPLLLPSPDADLIVRVHDDVRIERLAPALAEQLGLAPPRPGVLLDDVVAGADPPMSRLAVAALAREESSLAATVRLPRLGVFAVTVEVLQRASAGAAALVRLRLAPSGLALHRGAPAGLVGRSAALQEVQRKIALYAPVDASVVITGETGTGKELVAQALHDGSPRRRDPFVAVNCSALSEELLESELFGHEKGAFTGAVRSHRGRFERADGGTLFLDEIGDMPLHTQTRLLRVLESGRLERVGSEREQLIDVRVVVATNVPLEQAVGQGRFRADLYHRISVLRLHLPPLRERSEDIPELVEHFLGYFARKYGRSVNRLTPEALELLQSYLWPGNVRELRNVLERVFVENRAEAIGARAFAEWVRERRNFLPGDWTPQGGGGTILSPPYPAPGSLLASATVPPRARSTRPVELDAAEIRRALSAAAGNLAMAARLLGVHRATLYRYLKKLGLPIRETDEPSR